MDIDLRPVGPRDYGFLYRLLEEKTPEQNISHRAMPTWEEHVAFNDAKPYAEDYVILLSDVPAGRVYITKGLNEVGIHIARPFRRRGIARAVLKRLQAGGETLHANIAPGNVHSQDLFTSMGFTLVQHTYRWEALTAPPEGGRVRLSPWRVPHADCRPSNRG